MIYKPHAGENISDAAVEMVALANRMGETVTATFNDTPLVAKPGGSAATIVDGFDAEMQRRREEYERSPKYAEDQRLMRERQGKRDSDLAAALATAPPTLTLRNTPAWRSWVEKNQDPYGAACVRYADKWARIMEAEIARGVALVDCAERAASVADDEGITGFMYGCAVGMLAEAWVHGEQLRRWHNRKTQFGTEGDEANESGGVLNPALLRIGR